MGMDWKGKNWNKVYLPTIICKKHNGDEKPEKKIVNHQDGISLYVGHSNSHGSMGCLAVNTM
jgi:hypothetical protein